MTKQIKRLLILLIILTAAAMGQTPQAHAEGGLVFNPYWTYRTDAPVTDIETGDINGDGIPEVVILTADSVVHVLENNGDLVWRYEKGGASPLDLFVDNIGGERTAEILIGTQTDEILLSNKGELIYYDDPGTDPTSYFSTFAADLDDDGQRELLSGSNWGIRVVRGEGKKYVKEPWINFVAAIDLWAGDVDGDGQAEIIPTPARSNQVFVLDRTGHPIWQRQIDSEVGAVKGGDVDGDGQAEVVALSTTWELFLFDSDGRELWHQQIIPAEDSASQPGPDQLVVSDLDGDGQAEVVVLASTQRESLVPASINVFNGAGHLVWQRSLATNAASGKLVINDTNGDGQAEVVTTFEGQEEVYLFNSNGDRLAEYHVSTSPSLGSTEQITGKITGALAYIDLNQDGLGEVIVGTETGVQVFGTSPQARWRRLSQSRRLGGLTALYLADLDGNGQREILAGTQQGQVYGLANDGRVWWEMDLESSNLSGKAVVAALNTGNMDSDAQAEIVIGTSAGGGSKIYLIDDNQVKWSMRIGGQVSGLIAYDLDGDGLSEIIARSNFGGRGLVLLLDGQGELIWEQKFTEPVTAIGSDDGYVLVGTQGGRVYRLTATGETTAEFDLGAAVLSLDTGHVATAAGRIYQLAAGGPTLIRELEKAPDKVQINGETVVMLNKDQEVSVMTGDSLVWQGAIQERASNITAGDLNGDGTTEIVIGTESGYINVFGLALDQPPLLTKPDLTDTRTGYSYNVQINNPDGDGVTVTLEIWDPSANVWLPQAPQSLAEGQNQGWLTWEVTNPFDIWDSGQASRFRFSYDDGNQQGTLDEIPGPFNIPTTPWYLYYGQRVGLGALILLVPALGLVLYRRQRTYRRSPAGQAEVLLKQLQAQSDEILTRLHTLTNDNPALLTYLSGAAREAGETAIADMSEGFHLILSRPEVAGEALRTILEASERLSGSTDEPVMTVTQLYDLLLEALEANTVSRIVSLHVRLDEFAKTLDQPASVGAEITAALGDLGQVAQTLNNSQRVEAVEDKTAYLAQSFETLDRLAQGFESALPQPERNILHRIAANWMRVATNTLQDLQGRAQIEVALKTHQLLNLNEQAALSLELTNTGRSPASNIIVKLVPDQTFAVGNGSAQLDILPAGRSAVVELPVSAATSVEQFRAKFNITFDDRERQGKSLAFADRVHLLKPDAEFRPVPNPYAPGTPLVPGSAIFFGRDDLFQFIGENIGGLTRQNILVLIGQRRMGKTSFLQQLPARLDEAYLPVYLDGQSLGIDPGMVNFFYDLALAIVDALDDQGIEIEEPQPEDFEERPSGTFERSFLPSVFEAIGERQLLLLFDEFEELEMRVASGKLESTIFSFLRHLMQHNRQLGFIFVGTHRLEALSTDYWSIFFNIALYKHVAFLDKSAARALVTEPVAEAGLIYDDLALDKMLRVTAGHPYFLQLTCHALVNRANREKRSYLTIQDVNDVLDEMVERGEAHFAFLWEQSSPQEQLLLAVLMRLLGQEPTVTATQVTELLAERGVAVPIPEVNETLRLLVMRDIIREIAGQPPRYEYKIELVRLWVERYKTLGRVVEEVT